MRKICLHSQVHQSNQWSFKLSKDRNITWQPWNPAPKGSLSTSAAQCTSTSHSSKTRHSTEQVAEGNQVITHTNFSWIIQILPLAYSALPANGCPQWQATSMNEFDIKAVWALQLGQVGNHVAACCPGWQMKSCALCCHLGMENIILLPQKTAASWGGNGAGQQKTGWRGRQSKNACNGTAGTWQQGRLDRDSVRRTLDIALPDSHNHKSHNCVIFTSNKSQSPLIWTAPPLFWHVTEAQLLHPYITIFYSMPCLPFLSPENFNEVNLIECAVFFYTTGSI